MSVAFVVERSDKVGARINYASGIWMLKSFTGKLPMNLVLAMVLKFKAVSTLNV